jgi:CRP/FNR family transcriptional regulator, cyclic AMP receptor protein
MTSLATKDSVLLKLASIPMFADLSRDDLECLASLVQYRRFQKGAFIVSRGEMGTCMYLLASGRVKVSLASSEGRELVLNHLEAPAHFGEMALVDALPRTADVIATADVEVFSLDGKDLAEAVRIEPRIALSLVATLSRRLRHTIARLEDMAFHDATHRVMRVVLNTATAGFETRGTPVIQGMTHYDIATLAGTSRETASRVISMLAREGALSTKGRRILVDLEALSARLQRD